MNHNRASRYSLVPLALALLFGSGCRPQSGGPEIGETTVKRPSLALSAEGLLLREGNPYTGVYEMGFASAPAKVMFRVPIVDGRIHGAMLQFSPGGSVIREYHFDRGKWRNILGRYSAGDHPTYPWGQIKFVTHLRPETTPVFEPSLSAEGWHERIEALGLAALVGPHLRWRETGTLHASNTYTTGGVFDGLAVEYGEDGGVMATLRFENGQLEEVLEETPEFRATRLEEGLILTPEERALRGERADNRTAPAK